MIFKKLKTHFQPDFKTMILVNNGMPKSGSTLLFSYTKRLLNHVAPKNGYAALCEAIAEGKLKGVTGYVEKLDQDNLPIIEQIAQDQGPLTVKVHIKKDDYIVGALLKSRIAMVSTYRDPRDVVLSLIDHARRSKSTSIPVFQDCKDVACSIPTAKWAAQLALDWKESNLVTSVRYEDLITHPAAIIKAVGKRFGFTIDDLTAEAIIQDERSRRKVGIDQFNTGKLSRFREEMSDQEQEMCSTELGDLIRKLGYEV